jgi:hypothetical protein
MPLHVVEHAPRSASSSPQPASQCNLCPVIVGTRVDHRGDGSPLTDCSPRQDDHASLGVADQVSPTVLTTTAAEPDSCGASTAMMALAWMADQALKTR